MNDPKTCKHERFATTTRVVRLTETKKGPVIGFSLEVHAKCDQCGLPFRFMGVAAGLSALEPAVSPDGLELRVPLEPAIVPEILGFPRVSGRA